MSPSTSSSLRATVFVALALAFCLCAVPTYGQIYYSDWPIPFSGSADCSAIPNPTTPGVTINATCTCQAGYTSSGSFSTALVNGSVFDSAQIATHQFCFAPCQLGAVPANAVAGTCTGSQLFPSATVGVPGTCSYTCNDGFTADMSVSACLGGTTTGLDNNSTFLKQQCIANGVPAPTSATVLITLAFNVAPSDVTPSFLENVKSSVAAMANVLESQVQVTVSSSSPARRLLQSSTKLDVAITSPSTAAAESSFTKFKSVYTSSDPSVNPLQKQGVDNTVALTPKFTVTCADGSTKNSASECPASSTVNSAASASIGFVSAAVLAASVFYVAL